MLQQLQNLFPRCLLVCDEVLENLLTLKERTRIINTCSESLERLIEYSSGENYLWESSPGVLFEAIGTWSQH